MTDTTPTTPLDLDAAIEAGVREQLRIAGWDDTADVDDPDDLKILRGDMRGILTAIGYPALVEEVKRLREAYDAVATMRERANQRLDAAIARAEAAEAKVAAGLALRAWAVPPGYANHAVPAAERNLAAIPMVREDDLRAALTEVQA